MSNVFIGGHSLGAGRAMQIAFDRIKRGLPVDGIICAGCPRPGDHVLRDALALYMCPIVSLRNTHDDVTLLPFDLEFPRLAALEYVDAAPFTDIDVPWHSGLFCWEPAFNGHHIQLYQQAAPRIVSSLPVGEAIDEIARLYHETAGWDWIHPVDGQYFAMKTLSDGSKFLIARGSKSPIDFIFDFELRHTTVHGAGLHDGFWDGIEPLIAEFDRVLAL